MMQTLCQKFFKLPPYHFGVDFEVCCFEDPVEFGASAVKLLCPLAWLALQKLPVEEAFDVRLPVLFTDRLHLNDDTVVGRNQLVQHTRRLVRNRRVI